MLEPLGSNPWVFNGLGVVETFYVQKGKADLILSPEPLLFPEKK